MRGTGLHATNSTRWSASTSDAIILLWRRDLRTFRSIVNSYRGLCAVDAAKPLRDVSKLVATSCYSAAGPCASRIMLMAIKSRATKNAPRTRCVTIVVSGRFFIRGFPLYEFEHFTIFILSSYAISAVIGRGAGVGRGLGLGVGRGLPMGVTVGVALGVGLTEE